MYRTVLILLTLFYFTGHSQNEASKWYFGAQAGLDFMTSPPTVLINSTMTTQEGCASIADNLGNLLFYTDGITVYNKLHLTMSNGTGLMGNGSTTQSGVIVKRPSSSTIFYVFTADAQGGINGLRYSIVDMSLSSGNGSVTVKNVLLNTPTSEKITAVRHCNGIDTWVITHDVLSANFRTYLVTAAGVNTTAVVTSVGTSQSNTLGYLKASGNGRKLGLAIYTTNNTFELYDFDNSTGVVSNPLILGSSFVFPYGVEFSPDGKIFYGATMNTNQGNGTLYQWNLCAGSNSAVIASQTAIATITTCALSALQLAINGKIYVGRYLQSTLGVINSPNVLGTGCTYTDLGQTISPKICRLGLPNFITSFLSGPLSSFTYTFNTALSCRNATFAPPATPTCGSSAYTVVSHSWNFGDFASGSANTSTLSNPTHSFTSQGTFTTQLIVNRTCGSDTLRQVITVPSPSAVVFTSPATCSGPGSATVMASGGPYTYSWLPSNLTGSIASNLAPGLHTVIVSGGGSGCDFPFTTSVTAVNYFSLSVSGSTPTCFGANTASAIATATGGSGNYTYSWTGSSLTTSIVTNLGAGSHTVSVTDSVNLCTKTATFFIVQPPALTVTLSANSPSVCMGDSILINSIVAGGTPSYNYSWSSGAVTSSVVSKPAFSGTYVYTLNIIDSQSCTATNTVSIAFISNPTVTVANLTICPNETGTLSANGASTYTWNPGSTNGSTYTVSPASNSSYTVTGSAFGCTASAVAQVSVRPAPLLTINTHTINCANLGSGTVTASNGVGPFSFTWTPTAQSGSIATGLFPGSYTISVFDQGTGCTFPITHSFAPLIPLTGTVTSTPSIQCNADKTASASIALSGGSGNQTYAWKDANGTQTVANPITLTGGINTVTVIDALTFCTVTHTFFIYQPPALTINISASSPSVCMGDSVSFTALGAGGTPGYNYTWTPLGTNNALTVKESLSGIYTYSVTMTDNNNCVATKTAGAKFVDNPTVTVASTSICPLKFATLTAAGATTYSWSNNTTANPLIISPAVTTDYTVIGSALGCTAAANATVTVMQTPTVIFTHNSPVCQGDTLHLHGGGGQSYLWTGPLNFSTTVQDTFFHPTMPIISGNYTLKVTGVNTCTAQLTQSLTVNGTPFLSATSSTVCEGAPLTFTSNYLAGATYTWSGAAFTSNLQNPVIANSTPAMTGPYTITITSSKGCTNVATVQGSVVANPVITITAPNSVCLGDSISFLASGASSYSWLGPDMFYSVIANPVLKKTNINSSGVYTVVGTYGPCKVPAFKSIAVNPLPIPIAQTNQNPACEKSPLQFNTAAAAGYTWTGPNGVFGNSQFSILNPVTSLSEGVYTVTVIDNNSCVGKDTIMIRVIPAPVPVVSNATVCFGGAITLTVAGGANYFWTGPASYTAVGDSAFIAVVNQSNTGVYNVIVTGDNSCVITASIQLTGVNAALPVPLINAPKNICMNSQVTLSGSGGISYQWNGPNNFSSSSQQISFVASSPSVAGVYTLSVKNVSNCAASSTVHVKLLALPQGTLLISKNAQCVPFCTSIRFFESFNTGRLASTVYNIGKETYYGPVYDYCLSSPGDLHVNVTYRDSNNCTNTSTLTLRAYEKPTANFDYSPLKPLVSIDEVRFYNSSSGNGIKLYTWFLQGNTEDTLHEKNPTHLYDRAGLYPVVLIVKNTWGCSDTIIKPVILEDGLELYVPDAFTPNADGLNDIFIPKGQGVKNYSLEVFDRWGESLFYAIDLFTGWDGTRKGVQCKMDSYIWKIQLTDNKGNRRSMTGYVNLIR